MYTLKSVFPSSFVRREPFIRPEGPHRQCASDSKPPLILSIISTVQNKTNTIKINLSLMIIPKMKIKMTMTITTDDSDNDHYYVG